LPLTSIGKQTSVSLNWGVISDGEGRFRTTQGDQCTVEWEHGTGIFLLYCHIDLGIILRHGQPWRHSWWAEIGICCEVPLHGSPHGIPTQTLPRKVLL